MIYLNLSVVPCAYINTTRLSLKTYNSKQMKNIKNAYVCVSVCVCSHALWSKRNFAEPILFLSSLIFLNNLLCIGIVGIMKSFSSRGTRRQKWVKWRGLLPLLLSAVPRPKLFWGSLKVDAYRGSYSKPFDSRIPYRNKQDSNRLAVPTTPLESKFVMSHVTHCWGLPKIKSKGIFLRD